MQSLSSLAIGALSISLTSLAIAGCGAGDSAVASSDGGPSDDGQVPRPSEDAASGHSGSGSVPDATAPDSSGSSDSSKEGGEVVIDSGPPGKPIDAGLTLTGTITVDPTTQVGTIPPAFIGLSYEESQMRTGLFSGSDSALIAMFNLLGSGL